MFTADKTRSLNNCHESSISPVPSIILDAGNMRENITQKQQISFLVILLHGI